MHPQDRLARVVRLCFSRTETCCRSETTDDSTQESAAPGRTLLGRVPHHTTCIVSIDSVGTRPWITAVRAVSVFPGWLVGVFGAGLPRAV